MDTIRSLPNQAITEINSFNFIKFWTEGGFSFNYSHNEHIKAVLNRLVTEEKFEREYNGKIPVDVAAWETDWTTRESAPEVFKKISSHLLQSNLLKSYQIVYGDFTFVKHMFHRTPRDYINDYHTHTFDGSHLHVFIFFCPEERTVNDGGLSEIGEVLDKDSVIFDNFSFYNKKPKSVFTLQSYVPQTGLGLVVNNLNPYFRHRVTQVFSEKERYTLMLAFGHEDNCTKNKDFSPI
jgi:hypothetical protein